MTWDDASLLIVSCGIAGKFQHLSCKVLKNCCKIDWSTSTDALCTPQGEEGINRGSLVNVERSNAKFNYRDGWNSFSKDLGRNQKKQVSLSLTDSGSSSLSTVRIVLNSNTTYLHIVLSLNSGRYDRLGTADQPSMTCSRPFCRNFYLYHVQT